MYVNAFLLKWQKVTADKQLFKAFLVVWWMLLTDGQKFLKTNWKAIERIALIFRMVFLTGWLNNINILHDQSSEQFIVVLVLNGCYQSFVVSSSHYALKLMVTEIAFHLNQANVLKHMFDQANMADCVHISWHLSFVLDLPLL